MPNQFGQQATAGYSAGGSSSVVPGTPSTLVPLYDPRYERASRFRFQRRFASHLAFANSLYQPNGRWPARGWILLRRGDYNLLNPFQQNFVLQIDDFTHPPITFNGLNIIQARCVSKGMSSDPNAIYLVELTDNQGVLWNQWFQFPTTSQYNVRAPAYPGQYYQASMNAGTPWTWATMIQDLWTQMAAFLGPFPGMPSGATLTGTPENWSFPGASCWEALNQVLDLLGLTVACDLTKPVNSQYTIVVIGADDTTFDSLQSSNTPIMEDDFEYIDAGTGRVPAQVVVMFHKRNQYYGTEETVRQDLQQWQTSTLVYQVTVPAPAQFAGSVGTHYLWDDFTVGVDIDGNFLSADTTLANAIATERATQYYSRIFRGTGYIDQTYIGCIPFSSGSLVDGVCWKMDFAIAPRHGWVTQTVRGANPPWPLWDEWDYLERD